MAEAVIDFDNVDYDRVASLKMITSKGRAYHLKSGGGKHVSLHVYSTNEQNMITLVAHFGGNYYKHLQGYQWQCANRKRLLEINAAIVESGQELSPAAEKRLALLLEMPTTEPESPAETLERLLA